MGCGASTPTDSIRRESSLTIENIAMMEQAEGQRMSAMAFFCSEDELRAASNERDRSRTPSMSSVSTLNSNISSVSASSERGLLSTKPTITEAKAEVRKQRQALKDERKELVSKLQDIQRQQSLKTNERLLARRLKRQEQRSSAAGPVSNLRLPNLANRRLLVPGCEARLGDGNESKDVDQTETGRNLLISLPAQDDAVGSIIQEATNEHACLLRSRSDEEERQKKKHGEKRVRAFFSLSPSNKNA